MRCEWLFDVVKIDVVGFVRVRYVEFEFGIRDVEYYFDYGVFVGYDWVRFGFYG